MGKKVIMGGVSSRKTLCNNKNEKQLHGVIKVLKPKVYIIDSSSFKQLVQELTGCPKNKSHDHEQVVHHEENCYKVPDLQPAAMEMAEEHQREIPPPAAAISMDSSFGSLDLCGIDPAFQWEEINQLCSSQIQTADDISTTTYDLVSNQYMINSNWFAYQNLESWLLDVADSADHDPYSWYNNYNVSSAPNEQEATLFDHYELSSLI